MSSPDLLSGRIYGEMGSTNPARIALRKLMGSKERADLARAAEAAEPAVELAEAVA